MAILLTSRRGDEAKEGRLSSGMIARQRGEARGGPEFAELLRPPRLSFGVPPPQLGLPVLLEIGGGVERGGIGPVVKRGEPDHEGGGEAGQSLQGGEREWIERFKLA